VVVSFRSVRVSLPDIGLLPVQPSEAVHVVALLDDQVSVVDPFTATVIGLALRLTVGAPGGGAPGGVTFTVTERLVVPPAPVHASVNVLVWVSAAVI
jgi:hypothetical protein